jgi:putative FmdB family regulatory protein
MPIYEYRCGACGHELEALQKITDAPLSTCPACRADKLTKLVSAAGFQLKGSGWYATDFRNGSKPAAKTAGAEAKSDTKPDATTTDSKPADGKSETKSEAAARARRLRDRLRVPLTTTASR